MKLDKAAELDSIQPEHIVYAHPAVVMHLHNFFNLLIQQGHVPVGFGEGVIVPLVNDKRRNVLNSDNYRDFTISSIISKIFSSAC